MARRILKVLLWEGKVGWEVKCVAGGMGEGKGN